MRWTISQKNLKELKAEDILDIDMDYLNAIYRNLPEHEQIAWDKFYTEDYESEWKAFLVFMNEITSAALKKRTRIESLKEMKKSVDEDSNESKSKLKKKKLDSLATKIEDSRDKKVSREHLTRNRNKCLMRRRDVEPVKFVRNITPILEDLVQVTRFGLLTGSSTARSSRT